MATSGAATATSPAMDAISTPPIIPASAPSVILSSGGIISRNVSASPFSRTEAKKSTRKAANSFKSGMASCIKGMISPVSIWRPINSKMPPMLEILSICILASVSAVMSALSEILARASTPFAPRSSHIVPNRFTPAIFCSTGSFIEASAATVSLNACFALSPPIANLRAITWASKPKASKPSVVVLLPSLTRILNSLMASPTLSILQAPFCAPVINIPVNSSALKPSCLN